MRVLILILVLFKASVVSADQDSVKKCSDFYPKSCVIKTVSFTDVNEFLRFKGSHRCTVYQSPDKKIWYADYMEW